MKIKKTKIAFVLFFVIVIVFINLITSNIKSQFDKAQAEYFKNLDFKIVGVISNIEKQTDSYKYLITLRNVVSNYTKNHKNGTEGVYFCVTNKDKTVFADNYENYNIGDTIYIGENNIELIKCVNFQGKVKYVKNRKNGILYKIGNPNKRMLELLKFN